MRRNAPRLRIRRPATAKTSCFSSRSSLLIASKSCCSASASAVRRKSLGNGCTPASRNDASFDRRSAINLFSSAGSAPPASVNSESLIRLFLRFHHNPFLRDASINLSKSPSKTAWVLRVSTCVRRSLIRASSKT